MRASALGLIALSTSAALYVAACAGTFYALVYLISEYEQGE